MPCNLAIFSCAKSLLKPCLKSSPPPSYLLTLHTEKTRQQPCKLYHFSTIILVATLRQADAITSLCMRSTNQPMLVAELLTASSPRNFREFVIVRVAEYISYRSRLAACLNLLARPSDGLSGLNDSLSVSSDQARFKGRSPYSLSIAVNVFHPFVVVRFAAST